MLTTVDECIKLGSMQTIDYHQFVASSRQTQVYSAIFKVNLSSFVCSSACEAIYIS